MAVAWKPDAWARTVSKLQMKVNVIPLPSCV